MLCYLIILQDKIKKFQSNSVKKDEDEDEDKTIMKDERHNSTEIEDESLKNSIYEIPPMKNNANRVYWDKIMDKVGIFFKLLFIAVTSQHLLLEKK